MISYMDIDDGKMLIALTDLPVTEANLRCLCLLYLPVCDFMLCRIYSTKKH